MTISEYDRFGKVGWKGRAYTLCEDPRTDNSPRLNKPGFAFAVGPYAECDDEGYLRYALEHGFDPNTFDWGEYGDGHREKVIDQLTPKRRALFMEFGGKIHYPDAEIIGDEVVD